MKFTKKSLSVLLALLMILSSISCAFMSNAYSKDNDTKAAANVLAATMTQDVYDACLKATTDKDNIVIKDTNNRDVLTAMEAYQAVLIPFFAGCTFDGVTQEWAERNIASIKNKLAEYVQNSAAVGDKTKANAILDYLIGTINSSVTTDGLSSAPADVTTKVTISMGDYAVLVYDSIDSMPDNIVVGRTYCVDHGNGSYKKKVGFSNKTYYYNKIKFDSNNNPMIYTVDTTISKDKFIEFENTFKSFEPLFNATVTELMEKVKDSAFDAQVSALDEAYDTVVNDFSQAVLDKFYNEYSSKITTLKNNIDLAKAINEVNDTVVKALDEGIAKVAEIDDNTTKEELVALKTSIFTNFDLYNAKSEVIKNYINYDVEKINNAIDAIQLKIDIIDVTAAYNNVNAIMEATDKYVSYTVENASKGLYKEEKDNIKLSYNAIADEYKTIAGFVVSNIDAIKEVIGADCDNIVANIKARVDLLDTLSDAAGYSAEVEELVAVLESEYEAGEYDKDIDRIKGEYNFYSNTIAQLNEKKNNLPTDIDADLANTIIDMKIEEIQAKLDTMKAEIKATLNAQLVEANALVANVEGAEVTLANLSTFRKLKKALKGFDYDLYGFAVEVNIVSEEEIAIYDNINKDGIFDAYNEFVRTNGFNVYEESNLNDIVRYENPKEEIRFGNYIVSEEKVEAIIEILDKALASKEIKSLGVDLESILKDLPNMLYTDDFLNTMMGIFPVLVNALLPVWDNLGKMVENLEVDVNLDAKVAKINHISGQIYFTSLENLANEIGIHAFPNVIAEDIKDEYPEAAAVLAQSTTVSSYDKETGEIVSPWNDEVLYNEDGKLNLTWGITDRESFVKAASKVFGSFSGLLLAILSNENLEIFADEASGLSPEGNYSHLTLLGKQTFGSLTINADVHNLQAKASVDAINGYNNIIIPILEALNIPANDIINGDDLGSVEDILNGALNIIDALINKVAASPVDFIVSVLPNVTYALESGAVQTLLSLLNIHFSLKAGIPAKDGAIKITDGGIGSAIANPIINLVTQNGALKEIITESMFIENPNINLGELLDLSSLKINDKEVDLNSLNSILSLVAGLLGENFTVPKADVVTLATLGKLVEKETKRSVKAYEWGDPSKATSIEANKGDVLIFVLKYILRAAAEPNFLPTITKLIGGETPVEIPEIVTDIISNVTKNPNDSIAAITELVFPVEYGPADKDINWVEVSENGNASGVEYSEAWTHEKAEYVVKNFAQFIDNILKISGVKVNDVKCEDLGTLLENLIITLYTPETVNSIASKLSELVGGLDEKLVSVIGSAIGVDLSYWNNYNAQFESGDKVAFKNALVDVLSPLDDVLKFLIAGDNLKVQLEDSDGKFKVVEVQGYESYSYAIIPLVEALGATDVMKPAQFLSDKSNIASNLIDELLSVVDNLCASPYDNVLDLVMNLVYFIASDGVSVVVTNLTHSIEAVLEIIRPIYPTTLNALLGVSVTSIINDPISYLLALVADKVGESTGMTLDMDYTATEVFNDLSFSDVEKFTSANGRDAYRVTGSSENAADILTVVGRFVIKQIINSDNAVKLADIAKQEFNLDQVTYEFLYSLLATIGGINGTADNVLGLIFYIFFGANTAADAVSDYYKYYAYDWAELIKMLQNSDIPYYQKAANLMKEVYEKTFEKLIDDLAADKDLPINSEEIRGFGAWLQNFIAQIREIFNSIADLFKNLFK